MCNQLTMKNGLIICIWTLCLTSIFQSCYSIDNSNQNKSDTIKIVDSTSLLLDTLAIEHGDLNLDKISDLVVVFKSHGEDTIFSPVPKRLIKVYFGKSNGAYHLCCVSDNIIMTHDMGGASTPDPFDNVLIKDGILTVGHHGGMGSYHWNEKVSFKYSLTDKVFFVNEIEKNEGRFSDNPSETFEKEIVLTEKDLGKLKFEKYNVFNNEE
jgi:hypothetical protein